MENDTPFLTRLRGKIEETKDVPLPVRNWLEHADEEIAVVTHTLARRLTTKQEQTTERTISACMGLIGHGRSFAELLQDLQRCGILARATEEVTPGTYAAHDAQQNPSWNLGRMFYWMRKYMTEADLLTADAVKEYDIQ